MGNEGEDSELLAEDTEDSEEEGTDDASAEDEFK